ncbi:MAG: class I tRNA ligase family protein [archaeon]
MMSNENDPIKSPTALKEEETLKFWNDIEAFKKTLEKEAPKGDFVFYEGPPTANGRPGIHHLEARAFKDAIPRYKTMQGFRVMRKAGWDTHGLPVELQVEKELGLASKKEIETYGVSPFNKKCRESVLKYIKEWSEFTDRMGYWVDKENAYFTFNSSYMESIWSIIKKVDEQNLLYKDYKIVPWCPRCGTGLSSHELAQGYKEDKDLSVTVKFKLKGGSSVIPVPVSTSINSGKIQSQNSGLGSPGVPEDDNAGESENTYILAWTTTPWTLPGNVALAIGEEIIYSKVKIQNLKLKSESQNLEVDTNSILILAKERVEVVLKDYTYEVIGEVLGKDLVGLEYEPLYPYLKDNLPLSEKEKLAKAFRIYPASFVTTLDGTGVVHIAPMYGADDFDLGTKIGLPKYHLVRDDGTFIPETAFLAGRFVKDESVAVDIIKELASRSLLYKKEKYEHTYPHCWRCDTALIYFARDSWYIRMSELRGKLLEENAKINWEPDYIKDGRFGEWLKEVKDWALSRERYWGTPLPVWLSENGEEKLVIGSVEDIKAHTKKSGNKYFVMRHGEGEQNVLGILSSKVDNPHHLTEKGKEQVSNTTDKLKGKKVTKIISSPFVRTKETAEIIAEKLGLLKDDIVYDARIEEMNLGDFDMKDFESYRAYYSSFEEMLEKPVPNGESHNDLRKRAGEFLYEIDKKYSDENILFVTHLSLAWALCSVALGADKVKAEELWKEKNDFLTPAEYREFDFSPIPHNDLYELDLHKPYIDEIQLFSEKGTPLYRAKEVMDVWLDSGAMPFAQDHYPFENKDLAYPADFISEAIDQTRGWFYTLHAVGVLSGKGLAYKNVICLGHLNDKDGKKMSKSIGNVVDPWEMMNKYGVDAIRLWMYSVNQPGEPKSFDEKTVDEIVKKIFNLVTNVNTFYELYRDKDLESNEIPKGENVLDKWILSKLNSLVSDNTKYLDDYKLLEPVRLIREFVDSLSTWYLRRSRDRIREGNTDAKNTLYYVLKTLSKLLAPLAPFYAESLYQGLKLVEDKESVHLEKWPETNEVETSVVEMMDATRKIVEVAMRLRSENKIIVRQPLASLKLKVTPDNGNKLGHASEKLKEEYLEIIKEEINVKEIIVDDSIQVEIELDTNITPELKEEGEYRELLRAIQDLRKRKGLTPKDKPKLIISCDPETKNFIEKFQTQLEKTASLLSVSYEQTEGEEILVGDKKIKLELSI